MLSCDLLRLPSCLMMAASVLLVTHSSSLVTPSGRAPRHRCRGSMFLFTSGMLPASAHTLLGEEKKRKKRPQNNFFHLHSLPSLPFLPRGLIWDTAVTELGSEQKQTPTCCSPCDGPTTP